MFGPFNNFEVLRTTYTEVAKLLHSMLKYFNSDWQI